MVFLENPVNALSCCVFPAVSVSGKPDLLSFGNNFYFNNNDNNKLHLYSAKYELTFLCALQNNKLQLQQK